MPLYIKGIGTVSPQLPWKRGQPAEEVVHYSGDRLSCKEPDYSRYVDVRQLRRMSRIIKMGIAAGYDALQEAGVQVPNGIITGTSYGCLEDTGIFLTKMIESRENALNPTPFIQSTHNTIGSQVALLLQCQGYNQTYTQRAFSFENTLVDAMMELEDRPGQDLLAGCADEITATSHAILNRFQLYSALSDNVELLKANRSSTLNGEGAVYFVLSGQPERAAASIESVKTVFKGDWQQTESGILEALGNHRPEEMDIVLLGRSGDTRYDEIFQKTSGMFPESTIGIFKHLCGEFPTAIGLATAWAARMIESETIPPVMIEQDRKRSPRNILIINSYFGIYQSMIRLRAC